jgi:DnaJ-class molecular chaperone
LKTCPKCQGKGYEFQSVELRNGFKDTVEQKCSGCSGLGKLPGKKCHYCKGKRIIAELQTLNIKL